MHHSVFSEGMAKSQRDWGKLRKPNSWIDAGGHSL